MAKPSIYRVKEVFYSLQGEGARAGRAAVFCRFSKCNLWNGRESGRASAICDFCDTDIVGTDGQNGGRFESAERLATHLEKFWPRPSGTVTSSATNRPYIIFTGGEPLLQLDQALLEAMQKRGFETAIETNGTLPLPGPIDWVCLSPKAEARVVLTKCDELKLIYPQSKAHPEQFEDFPAAHYYLSPMASPGQRQGEDGMKLSNTRLATEYCLQHPQWKLSIQLHKILGID